MGWAIWGISVGKWVSRLFGSGVMSSIILPEKNHRDLFQKFFHKKKTIKKNFGIEKKFQKKWLSGKNFRKRFS